MTLRELFNEIAAAIREKTETTEPIIALDFPEKIRGIQGIDEAEYTELIMIADDILYASSDADEQMEILNRVMNTNDPYIAMGGTAIELENIYDEIIGLGGNG